MTQAFTAHKQRGLSLATALFVITVMAFLAAMIFQLIRSNAETTREEILLTRAFNAAESGVQFGLNAVFPPGPVASSCPANANYSFEAELSMCTAAVQCSMLTVDDEDYYTIRSTGTCDAVSRTVQVRAH